MYRNFNIEDNRQSHSYKLLTLIRLFRITISDNLIAQLLIIMMKKNQSYRREF